MNRPGMQDGRAFTTYLPNCQLNNTIQSDKGFLNNVEYKQYIQQNSSSIMQSFTTGQNNTVPGCTINGAK